MLDLRWILACLIGAGLVLAGCPDDSNDPPGPQWDDDDTVSGDDDDTVPGDDDDTGGPGDDDDTGGPGDDDDATGYTGQPGTYTDSSGGRGYTLHVPDGYDASTPIPLVIGFHGAGDSGSNFYNTAAYTGWTSAAAPAQFALLVPETLSPYSDFAVWSGNPNDDMDEMVTEMDSVLDLVDHVGQSYHLDHDRIHAFGFSDGGLFLGVAGLARFERFASLAVTGYGWGGFYPMGTPPRRGPVLFVCGTADSFHSYAQQSESYLASQGHTTRMDSIAGASHSFSSLMAATTPADVWAWIGPESTP
jgi:poly(3-hydroxybutyrate) depolymerase